MVPWVSMVLELKVPAGPLLILLFLSACSSGKLPEDGDAATDADAKNDRLADTSGPSDGLDSSDVGILEDTVSRGDAGATEPECSARGEQTCDVDKLCVGAILNWHCSSRATQVIEKITLSAGPN